MISLKAIGIAWLAHNLDWTESKMLGMNKIRFSVSQFFFLLPFFPRIIAIQQ